MLYIFAEYFYLLSWLYIILTSIYHTPYVFLRIELYFDKPVERVKIQGLNKKSSPTPFFREMRRGQEWDSNGRLLN